MNTNSKRLGAFLVAALFLTAIATTLRTVACLTDLDYVSGFFTNKALINAANIIITITLIGSFAYMFSATRINIKADFSTSSTYVPTGILGVATVFLGARALSYGMRVMQYPIFKITTRTVRFPALESAINIKIPLINSPSTIIGVIVAILAFLSIAYHFFNAFITDGKAEIRAYFSTAAIAFLSFYAILIYLDSTLSIGDSSKILRLTAFLLSALFFLYEARISLGREMWRIYAAFGLAASSVSAYTSIPAIITYYSNGEILSSAGRYSLASLEEYVLILALFIFITARLCLTISLREEKENALIKVLGGYAAEREEKANESFERYQEIFASKQLSIFDLYGGGDIAVSEEDEDEEAKTEEIEEKKELTISDDAIYEAIFGTMPERPKDDEPIEENEPEDERAPEEIAENILNTVDAVLAKSAKSAKKDKKENQE